MKVHTLDNHLSSLPKPKEFTLCNNFVNQLKNISNVSYKKSQIIIFISYYFISDL